MKPVEKISIIDIVVGEIKQLITSGESAAGDKLPTEKELCKRLNVGRSTVREAFRILQAMGYVEMKPGRGAFIARTAEEDTSSIVNWFVEHEVEIADFMDVRMAIEPLAVKLAIQRASDKEIQELDEIFHKFKEAVRLDDTMKLAVYDEAFHNQIVKATHNKLMISINSKIAEAFAEYRNKAFSVKENARNALAPHETILKSIKERNITVGQASMMEHLHLSMNDISKVVHEK